LYYRSIQICLNYDHTFVQRDCASEYSNCVIVKKLNFVFCHLFGIAGQVPISSFIFLFFISTCVSTRITLWYRIHFMQERMILIFFSCDLKD
jgi:hypothetical protein